MSLSQLEDELRRLVDRFTREFEAEEELKDAVIALARRIIKASGDAVVAIHRGSEDEASRLIEEASRLVEEALIKVEERLEYLHLGPLPQAFKEYVEAHVLLALWRRTRLPKPEELRVPSKPYVYGLAEVVGEVRRLMMEAIRRDRLEEAEEWFKVLESLYRALREFEVYRGVLPEIKGRVDQVRRVMEASRGDLALISQRHRLRLELKRLEERLRSLG